MVMKVANNATSTLAAPLTNVATSLTVAAGTGVLYPVLGVGDYFWCTMANLDGAVEIVKVTARVADVFTVIRGQDGTAAVAWNTGDKVELRLVAASINDIPKLDEVNTFLQPQVIPVLNGSPVQQPAFLTNLLYPSVDGGHRDMYRAGWLPYWFNQQWGGAQFPLPDGTFGDCATMQIQDDTQFDVSALAGGYYCATSFVLPESGTYDAVLVKLYKVGNPVYNLTARLYTDNAGAPNVAIGTAATISAKLISSNVNGEWYLITGLGSALTGGTRYHLVLSSLAAVDGANYIQWKATSAKKYPHGYMNRGTSVPAWTATTTASFCFAIPNLATQRFLQSGGQFDGKITFNQGATIDQSKLLCQPLRNFFDGKNFTFLQRYTGLTANQVIADFTYGLDHERLQIAVNASGFVVVSFYHETALAGQITGTTNVTTAGLKDIAVWGKFEGAGADFLRLGVNGAQEGMPLTAQTWVMSNDWRDLGTAILGGGFALSPAWTTDTDMSVLPSAAGTAGGWTWAGTAAEANAMSVSGGKLYQNANGYASTQTGYYQRTTTLNNATGWAVTWKGRAASSPNTPNDGGLFVAVLDGAKALLLSINEYFCQVGSAGIFSTPDYTIQGDFKTQEHTFILTGKGADYYLFIDGKLGADGTGKLLSATATNVVQFGDASATASVNIDAVVDYVKIYNGGMLLPTAATGAALHEAAYWSGDKSALLPYLYNAGTPVSVKQLCGVERNYIGEGITFTQSLSGVQSGPTTVSTTPVLLPDIECYAVGLLLEATGGANNASNAASLSYIGLQLDGTLIESSRQNQGVGGQDLSHPIAKTKLLPLCGLHKINAAFWVAAGTGISISTLRNLDVRARS